jgi:hypothetical protein
MKRIISKSVLASAATTSVMLASVGVASAATTNGGAAIHPAPTPAAHTTAAGACTGIGFTVLHNDRSGGVALPGGPYRVSSPNMSCRTASNDFTTFLNRYQGAIPGWTGRQIAKGYGTYTKNGSELTFTVKRV